MAGIYIHIPFCRQPCSYCNFYFTVSMRHKTEFLEAVGREIELQQNYLKGATLATIYFGGGTPSRLSVDQLSSLLERIRSRFDLLEDAEVTLEANPDDLDQATVDGLLRGGFNRLSIGIQSFDDGELRLLNRAHSASQALNVVQRCQQSGWQNLSIDLMFGLPEQQLGGWRRSVEQAIELGVQHISCYSLVIEPKTALASRAAKGTITPIKSESRVEQYMLLIEMLQRAGYEQYELTNFALPGFHSRHNSSYWNGAHYLGLGPAAHSFDGRIRHWTVRSTKRYIDALAAGELPIEAELLTLDQQHNEYLMTSLRTMWGTDIEAIRRRFGHDRLQHFLGRSKSWLESGHLQRRADQLLLTSAGKLLIDELLADLFIDDEPPA